MQECGQRKCFRHYGGGRCSFISSFDKDPHSPFVCFDANNNDIDSVTLAHILFRDQSAHDIIAAVASFAPMIPDSNDVH